MAHTEPPTVPENWADIKGYEGFYQVSSRGNVRSLDRSVVTKSGRTYRLRGTILTPSVNRDGYKLVSLSRGGRSKTFYVHLLVIEAFVGKRPEGKEACHNDGDSTNNNAGNLRWGTPRENNLDVIKHGSHRGLSKLVCPRGHPLNYENLMKSQLEKRGQRSCLACNRAYSRIRHHPELEGKFQEVSDEYYELLVFS